MKVRSAAQLNFPKVELNKQDQTEFRALCQLDLHGLKSRIDALKTHLPALEKYSHFPQRILSELDISGLDGEENQSCNYLLRFADISGIDKAKFIRLYKNNLDATVEKMLFGEPHINPLLQTLKNMISDRLQDPKQFLDSLKGNNTQKLTHQDFTVFQLLQHCKVQLKIKASHLWELQLDRLDILYQAVLSMGIVQQTTNSKQSSPLKEARVGDKMLGTIELHKEIRRLILVLEKHCKQITQH